MARNLYDIGDRGPDSTDSWLNEKEEQRSRIMPIGLLLLMMLFAAGGAILLAQIWPVSGRADDASKTAMIITDPFALCDDVKGDACVLSPESYAWRGQRYHLSDISVPSEIGARCPQEASRARQGRAALMAMMNGGAFEVRADPADPDPSARILSRDGVSIGQLMILKGHARRWSHNLVDWCAT